MHVIRNESMYAKKKNNSNVAWRMLNNTAHSASNKPVIQNSCAELRWFFMFATWLQDIMCEKSLTFSEFRSESESGACESLPLSSLMACTLPLPNPRAGREHHNVLATAADSSYPWMWTGFRHSTHLLQCQRSQNWLNWLMLWSLSLQFKESTRNVH